MNGGKVWKLITLALDRDPWKSYLMFMSRETDIKLCQIHTKIFIYTILYKSSKFKQIIFSKYTINLKTKISQRNLRNLCSLLFLYKFYTVLYQFLETGTSDMTYMGRDQELKWLAFRLYPLSFFLYYPFKKYF